MPQTAVDAADLVERYFPLARKFSSRWSKRYPRLADSFLSAATFALWKAALAWTPEKCPSFATWYLKFARGRMIDVLESDLRKPLPQFDGIRNEQHPIDTLASREPDPAEAAELADLPQLLETLPERRRAEVIRYFSGATFATIAAEMGGTPSGAQARVARGIERLQRQAGTAEKPPT